MNYEAKAMDGMFCDQPTPGGVSLIIPAFNEEEGIALMIAAAEAALASVTNDYEIIVVDDGSSDATYANAMEASAGGTHVRILRHDTNIGYGAAIRTGFAAAGKELLVFTDADRQFDLTELDRFLLLASDYDVVCGYRIDRQDPWIRKTYSKVYNVLVRALLGIQVRDIDCAMKLFHRCDRERLSITTDGFLVNAEMLTKARQNSLSVVEVGVTHLPRIQGHSTVSAAHIFPVLVGLLRFWWNRVMFAASAHDLDEPPTAAWRWGWPVLAVLGGVLLFTNLGYPLVDRDETRYAEIPREMLAMDDWLSPQLNFKPYYDKPPLLYWLCAGSYRVFGVSEWSARIVPASACWLLLVSTMCFAARVFDWRVATLSGIALLTMLGFLFSGRFLLIDGVLSLCVALTFFAGYESLRSGQFRWTWWMGAAVCCGLGVLAKGPVAGVLVGPPVFLFAWLTSTSTSARIRIHHWLAFAGIVFLIAAPWFVVSALHDPRFLYEFFYKHNITRFAGAYHAAPIWYFVPVALVGGHPWTFLMIPYGLFLFTRNPSVGRLRSPAQAYLLLWVLWCVVFFSMSKGKLATYIIPAAPAFGLLVGHFLDLTLFRSATGRLFGMARWLSPWLAAMTTCVAGLGLGIAALVMQLTSHTTCLWCVGLWISSCLLLLFAYRHCRNSRVIWGLTTTLALLLVLQGTHLVIPQLGGSDALIMSSQKIASWASDKNTVVATFGHEWSGVPFYTGRNDIKNFSGSDCQQVVDFMHTHPSSIVIVRGASQLEKLQERAAQETRLTILQRSANSFVVVANRFPDARMAVRTRESTQY